MNPGTVSASPYSTAPKTGSKKSCPQKAPSRGHQDFVPGLIFSLGFSKTDSNIIRVIGGSNAGNQVDVPAKKDIYFRLDGVKLPKKASQLAK